MSKAFASQADLQEKKVSFTRLSNKWDSAGTGRYVMNAAAWLANYERFGNEVVAGQFKH